MFIGGGADSGVFAHAELPDVSWWLTMHSRQSAKESWGSYYASSGGYGGGGSHNWSLGAACSIYKNNGLVQPNHYKIEYWIKFR